MKHNGNLTIVGHSFSIAENKSLNLGDILAIKSPGLGLDWIWGERERDVKKESMFCLDN